MRKVLAMKMLFLSLLSFFFAAHVHAGQASAVSADDAKVAMAQGAYVMDVRSMQQYAAGHLPQAAALPAHAAALPLQELAALLSAAGVDSSRTMLVVGEAGDANAQALWQRLAQVTSGRVLWLVGGVAEWQMRGNALTLQTEARQPVPQFLVSFDPQINASQMAGARVRSSALLERSLSIRLAGL
jgi:3-mercaptopyruvate sulfurtransferase SseA